MYQHPFLVESVNRWHYTSTSTSKLHVLVYTGAYLISRVGNLLVPLGQISIFKSKLRHTRLLYAMYTLRFFLWPTQILLSGPQKQNFGPQVADPCAMLKKTATLHIKEPINSCSLIFFNIIYITFVINCNYIDK